VAACGGSSGGGESSDQNSHRTPVNVAPTIQSVALVPTTPRSSDIIIATAQVSDPNGNLNEAVFKWLRNGSPIATVTVPVSGSIAAPSSQLAGQVLATFDQVTCEVTVYDTNNLSAVLSVTCTIAAPLTLYKLDFVCFSPYRPGQSPAART
jgi:hypothetical protein